MREIRWGILGAGNIARSFAQDVQRREGMVVTAVASRSQGKADQFAHDLRVVRTYNSYEALAAADIDVVYIATPHVFHYEQSLLCLEAGKPILVEKPFMMNADEAARVMAVAREKRLFCMEAMWMRFIPAMQKAVEMIRSGVIGEVQMISTSLGYYNAFDPENRLFNPALGGGAMLDLGVYPLSLIVQLLGRPLSLSAYAKKGATGVDEHMVGIMQFPNNAIAEFSANLRAQNRNDALIIGSLGTLHIQAPILSATTYTLTLHLVPGDGSQGESAGVSFIKSNPYLYKATKGVRRIYSRLRQPDKIRVGFQGNGLGYEAQEVARCLRQNQLESQVMPLDETLLIMELMDAIQQEWA